MSSDAPVDGPGEVDPFREASPEAARRNLEGKLAYRKGLWEAARSAYRAAEVADPGFLAPVLNVACSFVREERFDDAAAEVVRLVSHAYVPWRDEILAAADLGALKTTPQWSRVEAAFERSRVRWTADLTESVLFIGRTHAPLGPGEGETGVFLLGPAGPGGEIFAWSPRTRRTRQLTNEQGRVLALLVSRDRQRVAYLIAEKRIRAGGQSVALRGVTATVLDLRQLRVLGRQAIEGDVTRISMTESSDPQRLGFDFTPATRPAQKAARLTFASGAWSSGRVAGTRGIELSPAGVTAAAIEPPMTPLGGCAVRIRERLDGGGVPQVEVYVPGSRTWLPLGGHFGAALHGLPLP